MIKNFINYSFFSLLNSVLVFINGFLLAKHTSVEMFGLLSFYQVLIIGFSQLINWNSLGLVPIALSGSIRLGFDDYSKIIHNFMMLASLLIVITLICCTFVGTYDLILVLLMLLTVLLISSNDIDNSRLIGLGASLEYGLALFITRSIQALLIYMLGFNDLLDINSWLISVILSELMSLLYRRNFTLFSLINNTRSLIASSAMSNGQYIFVYGIKYFPILIFGYLYQYADRYFMKILMSPYDLGLFSYALLLSSSVSIFSGSLLNVFVPYIYKTNLALSKKILKFSFLIILIAGIFIMFVVEYMLPVISFLVNKPEIESLSSIFLLTSVGFIFQGMYKIVGALLDANILYWQKFLSFFVASMVNILVLLIFFKLSNVSIFSIGIAYLFGNLALFTVSLYFVSNYFKSQG